MNNIAIQPNVNKAANEKRERINDDCPVFSWSILISAGIILVLSTHLLVELNPRRGDAAAPPYVNSMKQTEGALRFTLVQGDEGELIITTPSRDVYRIDFESNLEPQLQPLETYLQSRLKRRARLTAIQGDFKKSELYTVLAVDRHLRYEAVIPVIKTLAKVGIDTYGFETMLARTDEPSEDVSTF